MQNHTINKRKFQVSPNIIYSLIKAQAGTLAKGVLECIMNSVDAGAKTLVIEITRTGLVITDDGKGFRSREEIEACFEVFGFEHVEGEREFGQFGIGRAQLWNFCSTVWHTNEFRMDVDIKRLGLDYDLVENVACVPGLKIVGKFYEPMSTSDVMACERELAELAMYASVPVTVNGTLISKDPSKEKWSHQTDEAWIQLSHTSRTLSVYNLGVKVREYQAWQFGCGGLVVTKPGIRLSLNMARNDILVADCKVWKKIKPFLQGKSDEVVARTKRLTEEQLANLASRALSGEVAYKDISSQKLITDVLGGRHTISEFYSKAADTADLTVTFVSKAQTGPSVEEAHKHSYCFVLDEKTLTRFGVATMDELMRKLDALLVRSELGYLVFGRTAPGTPAVRLLTTQEDWRQACKRIREGYTEIAHKDWTKQEQAAMAALRGCSRYIVQLLQRSGVGDEDLQVRELRLGVSEVAHAWTDGSKLIWINRANINGMEWGMTGAMNIFSLILHEYLHEGASSGTHIHDEDFYERFHTALRHLPSQPRWGTTLGTIVQDLLTRYVRECRTRKIPVKTKVLEALDVAETFVLAA